MLGFDQRLELADDLAAAQLDRADLRDLRGSGPGAGRLEVDDDERDLVEGCADVGQGQLRVLEAVRGAIEGGGR